MHRIAISVTPRCFVAAGVIGLAGLGSSANAEVPEYTVEVVATYDFTTTLTGSSDVGHVVGWRVLNGLVVPFLATPGTGITALPLPDGYLTGAALDVNDDGLVVGTVSDGGFPLDFGEPAVWIPDGAGGYEVVIPDQFTVLDSPLGPLAVDGGQIVAVNESGTLVGWSRYQGFGGGPSTRFHLDGPPQDLRDLGFEARVRDVNDLDVIVGDELKLDLVSGELVELGLPDPLPGNVAFTNAIAFCVNDAGEAVVAANLASIPTENWLTYLHADETGYVRLNEDQLPSLNVGFYDNNDLGDVSASGGVLFRAEDVLLPGFDGLLDESSSNWDTVLGFIADDRTVTTTAYDAAADVNAIVRLIPVVSPTCPSDLDQDGSVGSGDLVRLLAAWGPCVECPEDFNDDGFVGFTDLTLLLSAWADCP